MTEGSDFKSITARWNALPRHIHQAAALRRMKAWNADMAVRSAALGGRSWSRWTSREFAEWQDYEKTLDMECLAWGEAEALAEDALAEDALA